MGPNIWNNFVVSQLYPENINIQIQNSMYTEQNPQLTVLGFKCMRMPSGGFNVT